MHQLKQGMLRKPQLEVEELLPCHLQLPILPTLGLQTPRKRELLIVWRLPVRCLLEHMRWAASRLCQAEEF